MKGVIIIVNANPGWISFARESTEDTVLLTSEKQSIFVILTTKLRGYFCPIHASISYICSVYPQKQSWVGVGDAFYSSNSTMLTMAKF